MVIRGSDGQRRTAEDIVPVLGLLHRRLERIEIQIAASPLQRLDRATRRRIGCLTQIIDIHAEALLVAGQYVPHRWTRVVWICDESR